MNASNPASVVGSSGAGDGRGPVTDISRDHMLDANGCWLGDNRPTIGSISNISRRRYIETVGASEVDVRELE
jgi:hypothetical protein